MRRYAILIFLIVTVLLVLFYKLSQSNKEKYTYTVEQYVPAGKLDTLLVDMVTYMGAKPRYANYMTRHEPQYRSFYFDQAANFNINQYFVCENGYHYYYMIRPARHHRHKHRAIGGRMKLDDNWQIIDFEEVFATKPMTLDSLKILASTLFPTLIQQSINAKPDHMQWIEWPDDRCRYDKQKNEWRYDVIE